MVVVVLDTLEARVTLGRTGPGLVAALAIGRSLGTMAGKDGGNGSGRGGSLSLLTIIGLDRSLADLDNLSLSSRHLPDKGSSCGDSRLGGAGGGRNKVTAAGAPRGPVVLQRQVVPLVAAIIKGGKIVQNKYCIAQGLAVV